jgi:lysophospholipase L1-like esterase
MNPQVSIYLRPEASTSQRKSLGLVFLAGVAGVFLAAILSGCSEPISYGTSPTPSTAYNDNSEAKLRSKTPKKNSEEKLRRKTPKKNSEEKPYVAFVGDSITILASSPNTLSPNGAIQEAFNDSYRTRIEAQNGQKIQQMLDEILDVVQDPSGPPAALVLNLGSNNVTQEDPHWKPAFDQMINSVRSIPCVLLVTVNEKTDQIHGRTNGTARDINRAIVDTVGTSKNMYIVTWNEDWGPEMGYTPNLPNHFFSFYSPPESLPPELAKAYPNGMWAGDGIHQSPEGSVEMVRRIRDVLDQNCMADAVATIKSLSDS